jgi:hypothetical protein
MREAEKPNNEVFEESMNLNDSPQAQSANCPFYLVSPQKSAEIAKMPILLPASVDENEQNTPLQQLIGEQQAIFDSQQQQQVLSNINVNYINEEQNKTSSDWVAEPDSPKESLVDSEFEKLLSLNQELRAANNDLYEQVDRLTAALSESDTALQWQKKRASVTESMLNQQNQELAAANSQIHSLFQQLEAALCTVQSQEISIENYKGQLEINQQRLAQLERQCSLLQTNYNEQSHQVLQAENTTRELRTRLLRQQRQTLQFKAALEKCLESPVVGNFDNQNNTTDNLSEIGAKVRKHSKKVWDAFTKAEPIQPWSVQPQFPTENLSHLLDEQYTISSPTAQGNKLAEQLTSSIPEEAFTSEITPEITPKINPEVNLEINPKISEEINSEVNLEINSKVTPEINLELASEINSEINLEIAPEINPEIASEINLKIASEIASEIIPEIIPEIHNEETTTPQIVPHDLQGLDEQLDKVIQMFFAAQSATAPSPSSNQANNPTNIDNNHSAQPIWETFATHVVDDETPEIRKPTVIDANRQVTEDFWSNEISSVPTVQPSKTAQPINPLDSYPNDASSPSPVVNPKHPPKKRKSFASVELPNFGRNN